MHKLLLALLLAVPGPALAQDAPAPAAISVTATESVALGEWVRVQVVTDGTGTLVRVRQVLPGEDLDVSTGLLPLRSPGEYAFSHRTPGGYVIEAQSVVDGEIVTAWGYSRIGTAPDPEPQPPDPPTPVAGPRHVIILHETADTTPAWSRTLVDLRAGEPAKYLSTNKHRLWVLDDDDADPKWLRAVEGIDLPAIVISDATSGSVIHKGACPQTAQEILDLIKRHGG